MSDKHFDDANSEYVNEHPNCLACENLESELARVKEELEQCKEVNGLNLLAKIAESKIDPNDPRLARPMTDEEIAKSTIMFGNIEKERDALKVEIENIAVENCKLLESCDELVKALEKIQSGVFTTLSTPTSGEKRGMEIAKDALAKHREQLASDTEKTGESK